LDDTCEVMLLEPGSAVNTSSANDARRVTELGRV
jgi:hypothetical protein